MVKVPPQQLGPWATVSVHIIQEADWASGSIWTDVENRKSITLTVFRNLDRPAVSGPFEILGKAIPIQAFYRPRGFKDLEGQISRQSAHDGDKIISSAHRLPLPTRKYF